LIEYGEICYFLCVVSLFSCGKFFFVALNVVRLLACDDVAPPFI